MDEYTIAALENMLRWVNVTEDQFYEVLKTSFYSEYVGVNVCLIPTMSAMTTLEGLKTYSAILNYILDMEMAKNG